MHKHFGSTDRAAGETLLEDPTVATVFEDMDVEDKGEFPELAKAVKQRRIRGEVLHWATNRAKEAICSRKGSGKGRSKRRGRGDKDLWTGAKAVKRKAGANAVDRSNGSGKGMSHGSDTPSAPMASSWSQAPTTPNLMQWQGQEPRKVNPSAPSADAELPGPGLPSDSVGEAPSASGPSQKRCRQGPYFAPLQWENVTCPGCGEVIGHYKYHPSPGLRDAQQWQCRIRLTARDFGAKAPHFATKSANLEPNDIWPKNWVLQNKRFQCCDWDYFERLT